jgi:predicted PurR-regulated permease PerM
VREARQLGDDLPKVVNDLGNLPLVGDRLREAKAPERLQDAIEHLPERLSGDTAPIARAGRTIADGMLAAIATILLAITLLLDGPRLVRHAARLVPPGWHDDAERIANLAYGVVGRYVAGSVLVAGIAGLFVLAVGLGLAVPLAPLAALWVALWDLVPQIGGAMGGIPFVLLAVTHSATTGALCAVLFVLYLQIENHILQPLLVGHAVKLSPPATMTAALVGVSAAGVVGGLLAVPIVGAVKVVYLELRPHAAPTPEPPAAK